MRSWNGEQRQRFAKAVADRRVWIMKWTAEQAAAESGVARDTYTRVENSLGVSDRTVQQIAERFGWTQQDVDAIVAADPVSTEVQPQYVSAPRESPPPPLAEVPTDELLAEVARRAGNRNPDR